MDKLGADSCGKPVACTASPPWSFLRRDRRRRVAPGGGAAGLAPQDGSDRKILGPSDPCVSVVGPSSRQSPGS